VSVCSGFFRFLPQNLQNSALFLLSFPQFQHFIFLFYKQNTPNTTFLFSTGFAKIGIIGDKFMEKRCSVVIPSYNEEKTISEVISKILTPFPFIFVKCKK